MERGAKPTKAKAETRALVTGKSGKIAGSTDRQRLMEALEQQAATSEILRVISQSPTDVQPVFDAIAAAALKLCRASAANVFTFDGKLVWLASLVSAHPSPDYAETFRKRWPMPPGRSAAATRAILTRAVVEIPDVLEDADYAVTAELLVGRFPQRAVSAVDARWSADRRHIRRPDGGRIVSRGTDRAASDLRRPGGDRDRERAPVQRNEGSARAADGDGEILQVISISPTDVQPVFEAIAQRAATLSEAKFSYVTTFDGEWIHLRATHGPGTEEHYAFYPIRPGSGAVSARVIRDRAPVQIPDVLADAAYAQKEAARTQGFEAPSASRCCATARLSARSPSPAPNRVSSPTSSCACSRPSPIRP